MSFCWIPYTKAPNKCELNCMPRGERFYYRHKNQVIDGTPCDDENNSVCVEGQCYPVGCDRYLGSPAREDKCRVCRGDGKSCSTTRNTLDTSNLEMGYNDLLLIPAGATNILVQEVRPSNNYLGRINSIGEISPLAAIIEPHFLYVSALLYQEQSPGIEYEYSIPTGTVVQTSPTGYRWNYDTFSPCSTTCGGGEVFCSQTVAKGQDAKIEDSQCEQLIGPKPETAQSCNDTLPCPEWHIGPWKPCDHLCGEGKQIRSVRCFRRVDGRIHILGDSACKQEKPPVELPCNLRSCEGVDWVTSEWTDCEATCGLTTKTRSVVCASAKGTLHAESECIASKRPQNVSDCEEVTPCEYLWYTSEWSQCSAQCGSGIQTRQVFCGLRENNTVTVAEDDKCNSTLKLSTSQNCTAPEPCKGLWFAGPWSACSKKCGGGEMSRKVLCFIGNASVATSNCDANKILFTSEQCNNHPCNEDEVITVDPKIAIEEEEEEESNEECEEEEGEENVEGTTPSVFGTAESVTEMTATAATEIEGSGDGTELSPTASSESDVSESSESTSEANTVTSNSPEQETSIASDLESKTTASDAATTPESTAVPTTEAVKAASEAEQMVGDDPAAGAPEPAGEAAPTTVASVTVASGDSTAVTIPESETKSASTDTTEVVTAASSSSEAPIDAAKPASTDAASPVDSASSVGVDSTSPASTDTTVATDSATDKTEDSSVMGKSAEAEETTLSSILSTLSSLFPSSSESGTEATGTGSTDETTVTAETATTAGSETPATGTEATASTDVVSTTPSSYTDIMTEGFTLKKCKKKKKKKPDCQKTEFGCCFDGITPAKGPFSEGCSIITICNETKYGCCQDGVSPATGPDFENCPPSTCNETLFGCCPDGYTPAENNEKEGCPKQKPPPPKCVKSKFGCCPDNVTAATGKKFKGCPDTRKANKTEGKAEVCTSSKFGCCPDGSTAAKGKSFEGCKEIDHKNCSASFFGCCADGKTPALGTKQEGCPAACQSSEHGCCDDGATPAHGPNKAGCCLITQFGCCPDNVSPAQGPNLYGCDCQYAAYGCCPDNKTIARGPANEGCGCQYTTHGCCPDKYTPALGPSFQGCPCHTYQFGCCNDGVTRAKGPRLQGCGCENTQYGCCSDEKTPAPNPERNCTCEATKYGCCLDGISEAKGEDFFGCDVVPEKRGQACYLPKISGPCEGYYPTWYYDSERQHCAQFIYGGCLGNNNKFQTREECQQLCSTHSDKDVCEQTTEEGPCKGQFTRWTFDKASQSCIQFNYGGCQGNDNNFLTQSACHQRCLQPGRSRDECSLPRVQGSCGERLPRWFFDASENRCMPFYYSGCDGNGNNFDSQETCERACPPKIERDTCLLPAVTGECSNYVERWYYDSLEATCKPFYFGGCGGNHNNFPTREDCRARCDSNYSPEVVRPPPQQPSYTPVTSFSQESCFLQNDAGPCRNVSEALWYYDSRDGVCKQFLYGGCGGNGNRFSNRDECESRCGNVQDLCDLPKVIGPCNANYRSWYYDRNTDSCQQFDYGGCQGNGNRFEDELQCAQRCVRDKSRITQPPLIPASPVTSAAPPTENICFISVDPGPCLQEVMIQDLRTTIAPAEEPNVEAEEGNYVTLKCQIVMYPAPILIWTKGNLTIDQSTGRMRLLEGALQIIGLFRSDAGVYVCTADNRIQAPVRKEFNLVIRDPVERPAQVIGDESTSITVTLGLPTILQCYAIGWPRPKVTWWRGERMLPMSSEQFEQRSDYSLLINRVSVSNLGPYTCQAYNGLGRAASWSVTLRAVGTVEREEDSQFRDYLIPPSLLYNRTAITIPSTTTPVPERETPRVYVVPVTANISLSSQEYPVGAHISIPCDTDGYPIPQVAWYKDNYPVENTERIRITESNRLIINKAYVNDTGNYRCTASNSYSSAESSVYISVTGVYVHPSCTDSPFFANCKLIVRAQYCTHKYYVKFCCKSCTEAGLLPPIGPHLDLSENPENSVNSRKRRDLPSLSDFILRQKRPRYFKSLT
ncbi:unnamed protein product [Bemisia tabaci]|uniref:Papilin n=1 Tax=Bemisia tabaci TaxID=7038 RepID=A0A9P0A3D7_BEMTA|nr:unnamed protein product [Bemisia tabaci]